MANINDLHLHLHFHLATQADAAQVQQLVESAFRAEDIRPHWTADMELGSRFRISVDEILARITEPDSAIVVATTTATSSPTGSNNAGDILVGCVAISRRSTAAGGSLARLSLLAVDTQHQRGGAGRQILAYAEDYCRQTWGVTKFGLNALSTRQQLILWYMRCGYRKTGEVTPFEYKHVKGVAEGEELYFVELEKEVLS